MKKTDKRFKRKCLGCGQYFEKSDLIRIYIDDQGCMNRDYGYNSGFRGAYVCKNDRCIQEVLKRKSFNKSFHRAVDNEALKKLFEV